MDSSIGLTELVQEYLIKAQETIATVKIVEGKSEFQGRSSTHGIPAGR